jgi:hypothetical protein
MPGHASLVEFLKSLVTKKSPGLVFHAYVKAGGVANGG